MKGYCLISLIVWLMMTYLDVVRSDDQLLFVVDLVRYGSTTPKFQSLINATGVHYPQGLGQLTPTGMRQQYIRGREMRRRYIETLQFLSPTVDSEEIYSVAVDKERTYMSSMAYFSGLYPAGGTQQSLYSNQANAAIPPMKVDNCDTIQSKLGAYSLENNYQTVPIHSDAGDNSDLMLRAYDKDVCPFVKEIQTYELANSSKVNETFFLHNHTFYSWLRHKFNLNESIKLNPDSARYIIDEIYANRIEQRFSRYSIFPDEWANIEQFMKDYNYLYQFGNDTATRISISELFRFIVDIFDNKAKVEMGQISNSTTHLKKLRYWHASTRGLEFPAIVQMLQLSDQYRINNFPSSSFIFEFFLVNQTNLLNLESNESSTVVTSLYNRSNYYVKIYQDDKPVNVTNASCDEDFKCNWDNLAAFLESRLYKETDIQSICFNHLDYGNDIKVIDGNMPWWLAILIAVPLVIVTVIIIKCVIAVRQKRRLRRQIEQKKYEKNYTKLSSVRQDSPSRQKSSREGGKQRV